MRYLIAHAAVDGDVYETSLAGKFLNRASSSRLISDHEHLPTLIFSSLRLRARTSFSAAPKMSAVPTGGYAHSPAFDSGHLAVSKLHQIYFQQFGKPDGKPGTIN